MARPRKARLEGAEVAVPRKVSNPVPGDDGAALCRIVASFRARFPDEWAEWAKCPLESGLPAMAELLKGKG